MMPFDVEKLRALLEQGGVDVLLASTRPNVLYLTGGYYYHFHARFSRIGASQYLPFVGVPRREVQDAFFVGSAMERGQMDVEGLWITRRLQAARGTVGAAKLAAAQIRDLALDQGTIAVELPFLPADAAFALQEELPQATVVDATPLLDNLRARKTSAELDLLRTVYDRVAEAIQAGFAAGRPGITTADIAERVRREMTDRGLDFLWAFTCAGPSVLRAPSQMAWERGQVLHIDAGGEQRGYLADICRMGCLGEPSPLARQLYDACMAVQDRARRAVRAGLPCAELARIGTAAVQSSRCAQYGRFVAHGVGMVSHEPPVIALENQAPLEVGHVLSIETEFVHPEVGFVKIEDAVAVTETGCEGLGDRGREWQIIPV